MVLYIKYIYQPIKRKRKTLQVKDCKRISKTLKPQRMIFEILLNNWKGKK